MPSQSLPEARATVAELPAEAAPAWQAPAVLGIISGLLLAFAFPPAERGFLAWIALAPLFSLARAGAPRRGAYLGAWLGGLVFWFLAVEWIRRTDESSWLAWMALATYLSLYWLAFVFLTRYATSRLRLPLMLTAPVVWVALEFLQSHALTGLPWYLLSHSQYRYIWLIQLSEWTGAWGVSLLVAMVNAWWVEIVALPLVRPTPRGPRLTRPQMLRGAVVLGSLVLALGFGAWRVNTSAFPRGPRVALLQTLISQETKNRQTNAGSMLHNLEGMTFRAAGEERKPDLIVWPETAWLYGHARFAPGLDAPTIARLASRLDPKHTDPAFWTEKRTDALREFTWMAEKARTALMIGSIYYDFQPDGAARYNAALLFEPGRPEESGSFSKMHRVPFGEFVPLIETFPWIQRLTPYRDGHVPGLHAGPGPAWFDFHGLRLASVICFEDTVPHLVRRFFSEAPERREPDLLVNLSNDGWFGDSGEHEAHLAASIFRCVENRAPMVRAVNTGDSALIDGNGRIVSSLPRLQEGILSVDVPLDPRPSRYAVLGDWLPWTCTALTLGWLPLGWYSARRQRPAAA